MKRSKEVQGNMQLWLSGRNKNLSDTHTHLIFKDFRSQVERKWRHF